MSNLIPQLENEHRRLKTLLDEVKAAGVASEAGRRNFAVVVTTALHADVLELAAEGHRRVVFSFGGTPQWAAV